MSLIRASAPSAAQARGELGAAYVAMLVAMLVALHFVAIVTGCCPATTLNSFQVKAKLSGATVILTAGSNWTQRDVIAAIEAKTGRSLRGCYLKILARGGKTLHGGKKARKLGALLLRKDSVIEVWHRMHGGMGCAGSKVAPLDVQLQESAAKALEAAVQAYGIAPGPPEAQALALAQKGLWAETWDGGETWHEEGNKEKALPAALVEAELAAKAAVEAQNLEKFGTTAPNSDKAAKFSHALSFPIWFIVQFTDKHKCWNWKTSRVVRDIIKPMTAMTRCRFAELPEFRDIVGAAQARRRPLASTAPTTVQRSSPIPPSPPQSFGSHCWGAEWGLLVAALADGADPNRRVWIDVRRPVVANVVQRRQQGRCLGGGAWGSLGARLTPPLLLSPADLCRAPVAVRDPPLEPAPLGLFGLADPVLSPPALRRRGNAAGESRLDLVWISFASSPAISPRLHLARISPKSRLHLARTPHLTSPALSPASGRSGLWQGDLPLLVVRHRVQGL